MTQAIPAHQREDAARSLVYEANARVKDPVYGCVGAISILLNQVSQLQMQLSEARAEILCIQMLQKPTIPNHLNHDVKSSSVYPATNFNTFPQSHCFNFESPSNVIIQDPLKSESLWT